MWKAPPTGDLFMVTTRAAPVKVLRTRKSLPASPVVPPLPPARTSLAPPDFCRVEIPPHHGDAVQLQLSNSFLPHLSPLPSGSPGRVL